MRPISIDKLKVVAEAFRVSRLLAEWNADNIYSHEDFATEAADGVAQDLAIISERIRVAQSILDDAIPGFAALVSQADVEAQERARAQIAKENRNRRG